MIQSIFAMDETTPTENAKLALAKYIAFVRGIIREFSSTQADMIVMKDAARNNEMSLHTLELNLANSPNAKTHIDEIKEIVKSNNEKMSDKVKEFHSICDNAANHLKICYNFNTELANLITNLNACAVKELPSMSMVGVSTDMGQVTSLGSFAKWSQDNTSHPSPWLQSSNRNVPKRISTDFDETPETAEPEPIVIAQ